MTTYYVSAGAGDDGAAGTSKGAPLATLQAAADRVRPGDTVLVMSGTYTAPVYGAALDIDTSGTANAPITFAAAPGEKPVIDSSGGWEGIIIEASYITVRGFTVVGDAAHFGPAAAAAEYGTTSAELNGNGIFINPGERDPRPSHITIIGNTVYNEPGNGIGTEGADYVSVLYNVVHHNANWSAFGCSGISISTSVNADDKPGPHDVIKGNVVYGNAQRVPTAGAGDLLEGEGIILDTNLGYTGEIVVEHNTVFGNGNAGIESYLSPNVKIVSNTVYGNNTQKLRPANEGQIFVNQSENNHVAANVFVKPTTGGVTATPITGERPPGPQITKIIKNADHSVTLTGRADAGALIMVWDDGGRVAATATAGHSGTWAATTSRLAPGAHAFTASETTSAGTSVRSAPFGVTLATTTTTAASLQMALDDAAAASALADVLSAISGASPSTFGTPYGATGVSASDPSLLSADPTAHPYKAS